MTEKIDRALEKLSAFSRDQDWLGCYNQSKKLRLGLLTDGGEFRISGKVIDGDALAWAFHYELKSLYQLTRYDDFYSVMNSQECVTFIPLNIRNYGYDCSLMMEVCYRINKFDEIIKWAEACYRGRLREYQETGDAANFHIALESSVQIVQMTNDKNLELKLWFLWERFGEEIDAENIEKSGVQNRQRIEKELGLKTGS